MNKFGILAVLYLVLVMTESKEGKRHYIQMGKKVNPGFKKGFVEIGVQMGDFLDINCPQYDPNTDEEIVEKFLLYPVADEKSYKDCKYDEKLVVLACTTPFEETTLTLKFQTQSPSPLGFKFKYGQTYYYLGIPVGEKSCHNSMKVKIKVAEKKNENNVVIPEIKEVHKPATESTTTKRTTTTRKNNPKLTRTTTKKSVAESQKGNSASSVRNFKFLLSLLALLTLQRNL